MRSQESLRSLRGASQARHTIFAPTVIPRISRKFCLVKASKSDIIKQLFSFRAPDLRPIPGKLPLVVLPDNEAMRNKGRTKQPSYNAVNTSCYVQVLGLGTDIGDSAASVLLFFDRERYLFNVGEGFQRFAVEHSIKLSRLSHILATRLTTDATGGLPGLALTMGDVLPGKEAWNLGRLKIFGPQGLKTVIRAVETFVDTRGRLGFDVTQFGKPDGAETAPRGPSTPPALANGHMAPKPIVQTDAVTIYPIAIFPPGSEASSLQADEPEEDVRPQKRIRTDFDDLLEGPGLNGAATFDNATPPAPKESPAACYVCQLPFIPGKLLVEKCEALGVPRGPMFSCLKAGQTVTTPSGTVVHPHQVLEPGSPGPVAMIVDCPSEAYLAPLVGYPGWDAWRPEANTETTAEAMAEPKAEASTSGKGIGCMIHLGPAKVVALPEYQAWVAAFGEKMTHIYVNSGATSASPVMLTSRALQARLNVIHPAVFPLPQVNVEPVQATPGACSGNGLPAGAGPAVAGTNLIKMVLRPVAHQGLSKEDVVEISSVESMQAELRSSHPDLLVSAETAMSAMSQQALSQQASTAEPRHPALDVISRCGREEMEIVFLGTGAAIPSKYRNVTSTYLHLFKRGGMLMDCGEGTFGQLVRRYGGEGARNIAANLRLVWISHIHADHHAGLPMVLDVRQKALGPDAAPLLVVGPRQLARVLQSYGQLEALAYRFLDCAMLLGDAPEYPLPYLDDAKEALGLTRLECVRVIHCAQAFGLAIRSESGWSLVNSGDTRPCPALVEAAKDVTVLIHEATFEDALADEAVAKRHSLTCEAVEAGRAANAYRTILSHFSQRYPKIPVIDPSFRDCTCIAFDLMSVNLADLPFLPSLVAPLQRLFDDMEKTDPPEEEPVPTML